MNTKDIQALQDLQKALLSINGASRRLGVSTEEVIIILPRHDFSYFKNVLESGNGSLAKFYIPVDDNSFKLSGITVSRSKGEKEIYVKELAQKYQNDIDERSYVALLNYKVDIND